VYTPLGHAPLRRSLAAHHGSFALVGPSGVGKRGVVAEWVGARSCETLQPGQLARAVERPGLLHLLDATTVTDWTPFLRPLEEDAFPVVVIADHNLPAAVASRLPVYRAGYLTEPEVFQVLARHFPGLTPRPLLARLAQGSLDGIQLLAESIETFETLGHCLADGTPPPRRSDPFLLLTSLRAVCRAVLGLSQLPINLIARSMITSGDAVEFLRYAVPRTRQEASNLLILFLARFRRG
jgi:hypothetical protein